MTKKFICVQGSPEIPKGTIALPIEGFANYTVQINGCTIPGLNLSAEQVEGNSCWEEVKEEPAGRWVPESQNLYYSVLANGLVSREKWHDGCDDDARYQIGNVFRTREEAQDEVKRRNSIAKAWWPEEGEDCYIWFSADGEARADEYNNNYIADAYIGAIHPTKEACEEWGKTYGHLFDKRPNHGE